MKRSLLALLLLAGAAGTASAQLTFGGGLHFLSISEERVVFNGQDLAARNGPDGTTNFGLDVGAGTELALGSRTGLFLQATYTLIFASGGTSSYVPVMLGVSF